MIKTKNILTLEDFQDLKKGDLVVCEFKLDMYKDGKMTRFAPYTIYENKLRTTEIILQKKENVYFNYDMFLSGESICKSIVLLTTEI
jgi:hypothetical protein